MITRVYFTVEGSGVGAVVLFNPKIAHPSTLRSQILGLKPDHSYRFLVWARTQRGRGDPSFIDVETTTSSESYTISIRILTSKDDGTGLMKMS